jgi:hypothetical protein
MIETSITAIASNDSRECTRLKLQNLPLSIKMTRSTKGKQMGVQGKGDPVPNFIGYFESDGTMRGSVIEVTETRNEMRPKGRL